MSAEKVWERSNKLENKWDAHCMFPHIYCRDRRGRFIHWLGGTSIIQKFLGYPKPRNKNMSWIWPKIKQRFFFFLQKKKIISWFLAILMTFQSYTALSSTLVCSTSLKNHQVLLSINILWVPEISVSGIAPLNKARNISHFIVWKGGDFFFGCCSRYFGGLKRCN